MHTHVGPRYEGEDHRRQWQEQWHQFCTNPSQAHMSTNDFAKRVNSWLQTPSEPGKGHHLTATQGESEEHTLVMLTSLPEATRDTFITFIWRYDEQEVAQISLIASEASHMFTTKVLGEGRSLDERCYEGMCTLTTACTIDCPPLHIRYSIKQHQGTLKM